MAEDKQIQLGGGFDLNALLGEAMQTDSVVEDPVVEQGFQSAVPMFVNIPQETSTSYPSSVRLDNKVYVRGEEMIVIAERDSTTGDYTRYYTDNLRFALVDTLQVQRGNKTLSARTMWPLNQDGSRDLDSDGPACRSLNGLAPLPRYIGEEVFHPGHGRSFRIGFKSDNKTPVSSGENVCQSCPMSSWLRDSSTPQPCKENTGFIVWIAPQEFVKVGPTGKQSVVTFPDPSTGGTLARLSGNNVGIQLALTGRKENKGGAMADGSAIKAISDYYKPNTSEMVRAYVEGLPQGPASQYVIGISKSRRASDLVPMQWGEALIEEFNNDDKIKFVVLEVPSYDVYPEGNPLNTGTFTTVLPLEMRVGKNNFKTKQTSIPVLTPSETPMTQAEFGSYLTMKMDYMAPKEEFDNLNMRQRLLGVEFTVGDVNGILNEHRIAIAAPQDMPALSDGVMDAEYEEIPDDDMN